MSTRGRSMAASRKRTLALPGAEGDMSSRNSTPRRSALGPTAATVYALPASSRPVTRIAGVDSGVAPAGRTS